MAHFRVGKHLKLGMGAMAMHKDECRLGLFRWPEICLQVSARGSGRDSSLPGAMPVVTP